MIITAVKKIIPNTKKFREYVIVGKILLKNPNTTHSHLIKAKKITFCDANYYQFRRKFCILMGLELTAPVVNKSVLRSSVAPVSTSRKKPQLYTVLYETESNGYGEEAKSLLVDFIDTMNREKAMGTLEMVETVSPRKAIEVRSYS